MVINKLSSIYRRGFQKHMDLLKMKKKDKILFN